MGVVDSSVGSLVIIKTIINMDATDERTFNVGSSIVENSLWCVEKAATLLNFNKSYLAT